MDGLRNLAAQIETPLISAVFPPKQILADLQQDREPSPQIPVHQGQLDEALAVPQQQLVGPGSGVQCLLGTPNNDAQQVAPALPVQNVSSRLLV